MRRLLIAGATLAALAAPAGAVEDTTPLPNVKWSFSGPFGTFDRAAAQRGFQVYNEVCSACHSMRLLSYRDLEKIGLTTAQIKAIAATKTVEGPEDDEGKPTTRPGLPSDHFVSPFPNDKAARAANNGALPPDQSLIEKAREGGSTYIYALVGHGYIDPPAGVKVPDGLYYNQYFPGHNIHMPPPLSDGSVTYADGTKATIDQEARDVATFLTFASNPEMEQRKHMGIRIVGFIFLLGCVTYGAKRQLWKDVH
jgi:ubiquinol-cytochrome c reductase cytochrome c1 subunit